MSGGAVPDDPFICNIEEMCESVVTHPRLDEARIS